MEKYDKSKTGRKIRKDSFEFKNDMKMVEAKLLELYVDRKLSTNQIPTIFKEETGIKITSGKCYEILNGLDVLRGKSESVSLATSTLDYSETHLNSEMIGIIDGIVIGDGSISANHSTKVARLSISGVHEEFIKYCKKLLSPYDACDPVFSPRSENGKGDGIWATRTKFHPDLYRMYNRWYDQNGIKDVPSDASLSPIAILLWYLGDGSLSSLVSNSVTMYFATNSFSKSAIEENLSNRLEEMGFLTSRNSSDNRLFIRTESILPLLEYMGGESPVKCYSYKFNIDDWRKKKTMKAVAKELDIDYDKLAALVKSGRINHSRSPGGKKVLFSDDEFNELSSRISAGDIPREKHKKTKTRLLPDHNGVWDAQVLRGKGESDLEYVDRMARIFIKNGFPYKRYSKDKLQKEWFSLRKSQYIIPSIPEIQYRRNGLSFADNFHPHMFSLSRRGKISPFELFNNHSMLSECLIRNGATNGTLTYAKLHSAVCSDARSPRLNNFPPLVARDMFNYYCSENDSVIDPCAGFGGRLIGASICKHKISYTGIEPSDKTYFGLVDTQRFIKEVSPEFQSKIMNGCAEDELKLFRDNSFDFCFTSPPYFDAEEYSAQGTQSYIRYGTYAEWRDGFLKVMIENVFRVLRDGKAFAINIGKAGNYDISHDAENISLRTGFLLEERKNISFPVYSFSKTESNTRLEPLLILRKPV